MMGASATRAPPGRFAPRVQGEKMGLIPLGVDGSRSKYVHDLGAWPKRSQGSHLPQLLPLGNLGQPVSLTLESSAKSSCCSSVFWSHSDPVLPPPLRSPHIQGLGMCLRSHYKPSHNGGGVGGSVWHPGPLTPSSMGGAAADPNSCLLSPS